MVLQQDGMRSLATPEGRIRIRAKKDIPELTIKAVFLEKKDGGLELMGNDWDYAARESERPLKSTESKLCILHPSQGYRGIAAEDARRLKSYVVELYFRTTGKDVQFATLTCDATDDHSDSPPR